MIVIVELWSTFVTEMQCEKSERWSKVGDVGFDQRVCSLTLGCRTSLRCHGEKCIYLNWNGTSYSSLFQPNWLLSEFIQQQAFREVRPLYSYLRPTFLLTLCLSWSTFTFPAWFHQVECFLEELHYKYHCSQMSDAAVQIKMHFLKF